MYKVDFSPAANSVLEEYTSHRLCQIKTCSLKIPRPEFLAAVMVRFPDKGGRKLRKN